MDSAVVNTGTARIITTKTNNVFFHIFSPPYPSIVRIKNITETICLWLVVGPKTDYPEGRLR